MNLFHSPVLSEQVNQPCYPNIEGHQDLLLTEVFPMTTRHEDQQHLNANNPSCTWMTQAVNLRCSKHRQLEGLRYHEFQNLQCRYNLRKHHHCSSLPKKQHVPGNLFHKGFRCSRLAVLFLQLHE